MLVYQRVTLVSANLLLDPLVMFLTGSNGKHEAVLDQSSGGRIIHLFPQGFGSDILRSIGTQSMLLNS